MEGALGKLAYSWLWGAMGQNIKSEARVCSQKCVGCRNQPKYISGRFTQAAVKTQLLLVPFSSKPPTVYQAELLSLRYGSFKRRFHTCGRFGSLPKLDGKSNLFLKNKCSFAPWYLGSDHSVTSVQSQFWNCTFTTTFV